MRTGSLDVAVVGVGNVLRRDDGVGIHAVRALSRRGLPEGAAAFEVGLGLYDELGAFARAKRLIIVDAVRGGGRPGEIYRFDPRDVEGGGRPAVSLHELGVLGSLKLARLEGIAPEEVTIVGVEPADMGWSTALSAELADRLDTVVEVLLRVMQGGGDACH